MNFYKTLCIHSECTEREHCLRQIYYNKEWNEETMRIITPRLCTGNSQCPYYLKNDTRRICYGFIMMLTHLTRRQEDDFRNRMKAHFGHNTYFMMRRGERPIRPDEQQVIAQILNETAPDAQLFFDREENLDAWSLE